MTTRPDPESAPANRARLVGLLLVVAIVGTVAWSLRPRLIGQPKYGNEPAAIGALKTLTTSQALFREGDKDLDGAIDYAATLAELSEHQLIDEVLGSGTKQGYLFWVTRSPAEPTFRWAATARPMVPRGTGDRYFATNHLGVIFYTTTGPIPIDPHACAIPPGPKRVGQ